MDTTDKNKVIELLATGKSLKEISELLTISYSSLVMFNAEYEEAKALGQVSQLLEVNQDIRSLTVITKKEDKATILDVHDALVNSALAVNVKLNTLILAADTIGEISCAAAVLCELNDSFSALLVKSGGALPSAPSEGGGSTAESTYLSDAPGELE